jgi:hypothetical protein
VINPATSSVLSAVNGSPELALVVRMSSMAEVRCTHQLEREGKPCNKLLQVIFAGTHGDFGFYCARCHVRTRTHVHFDPKGGSWLSSTT